MLIEFFDGDASDENSFVTVNMNEIPRVGEHVEFAIRDIKHRFAIKSVSYRFETKLVDHQTTFNHASTYCCMDEL